MTEWVTANWPIIALGLLVLWAITKGRRHAATKKADETKTILNTMVDVLIDADGANKAEGLLLGAFGKVEREKLVGKVGKVVMIDIADRIEASRAPEKIVIEDGDHELDALAKAAVKSTEAAARVKNGLKTVGSVTLKVLGAVL